MSFDAWLQSLEAEVVPLSFVATVDAKSKYKLFHIGFSGDVLLCDSEG